MTRPKRQHWNPKCYLKAWLDPGCPPGEKPHVWRIDRETRVPQGLSIDQVCVETHLYTIQGPGGTKDYSIEQMFCEIEGPYEQVIANKIMSCAPLAPEDLAILNVFAAAMMSRTPAQRDHIGEQWRHIVNIAEDLQEAYKDAPPEKQNMFPKVEAGGGPSITLEQARAIANYPLQHTVVPMMKAVAKGLSRMCPCILVTDTSPGFITSDAPCVMFDPTAYRRPPPYRSPGLGYEQTEVTLPLTSGRLLFFSYRPHSIYLRINEATVDEINRRTQFHANRHIISSTRDTRAMWFEPGKIPPDAWENTQDGAPRSQ
jgi:uncharacterized protein DUF4238